MGGGHRISLQWDGKLGALLIICVPLGLLIGGFLSNWNPDFSILFQPSSPATVPNSAGGVSAREAVLIARGIVSWCFGLGALWLILSGKGSEAQRCWAAGIIGTVVGYWLKG